MQKRELSDDVIISLEGTLDEVVECLKKFKVGEYWEKYFSPKNLKNTTPLLNYIKQLEREGLDIGKGEAQFGYKMPLPKKDQNIRYLQIFRRN